MEIDLRPTTTDDLDFVIATENDPVNRRFVVPWSREQHEIALQDKNLQHWIVQGDRPTGYIILAGLNSPDQSIEMRRIVITEKGQGLGRRAIKLTTGHVFDQLKAHRFWTEVKQFDLRTQHLYKSLGFIEEGRLRDCSKGPEGFETMVLLAMLQPEYEQIVG
ncbi:MAG: GNAT family N-acetyltransferase [Synechococcales cyanobacterium RM1_1_8]|nr:GNAT family N-acetyltransferase [Synechococcales cyanobacterium RM1_1_8]